MNDPAQAPRCEEVRRYLEAHPGTTHVDAVFVDLCGVIRGKRYPVQDIDKLWAEGFPIPHSLFLLDATGHNADPGGRGFSDGDPDGVARVVPGTLAPVPWSDAPLARVLMGLHQSDGAPSPVEPRHVAARVLERLGDMGLVPCVAFELEFYLVDRERDAAGRPQPPPSPATGERERSTQVYGMNELDGFADFFADVEAAARAQGIPASVATSEFAAGQYEVNLRHVEDALAAADHCAFFRHLVQRVAARHGMAATFMSKPYLERTGSGMHVHVSLLDRSGANVFAGGPDDPGDGPLGHAVGGLLDTMYDAMAVFAPSVNAQRRFGARLFTPVTRSWAVNNRSTAVRIPIGPPEARRIEHRVSGADANPYLVLAAVLAGIHHGLIAARPPGVPAAGNAGLRRDPRMPAGMRAAIERLRRSRVLREYLGDEYTRLYCATKLAELEAFHDHITAREYEWYL